MELNKMNFREIFCNSDISTGKLTRNLDSKSDLKEKHSISVLYRCFYHNDNAKLYFMIYDFQNLFFCCQTIEEVLNYNIKHNSSLEFKDTQALIDFLLENVIKPENNLFITQDGNNFNFEILVNIIKVKWAFNCEKIDSSSLIQDLFANPMLNLLFVNKILIFL